MKFNKILLKILFFIVLSMSYANANQKIVFIDIQKILTESISGKYLNSNISKLQDKKIIEFKKDKVNFQNEEKKLIGKKNILEKSKFEEQVNILRTEIITFNNKKKKFSENLNKKRLNGTNKILNTLNPILKDYASKNSISIILQKKNILLGENSTDITQDIIKLLDNKIKKISLE
jgi:outer membrane protein